jgi:hypothetical protein
VAPLERFLHEIGESAVQWRTLIAYKGRKDLAQKEIDDVRRSRKTGSDYQLVALEPPFLAEERCLIVACRAFAGETNIDKPEMPR